MRLAVLAVLSLGTPALCQSAPSSHVDPDKMFELPQKYIEANPDPARFPTGFDPAKVPMPTTVVMDPPKRPDGKQIDPGIILRPPAPRDGQEGQPVARNLYPDLRLVPINRR